MKTREIMTPNVCCVRPSDTLTSAAAVMRDHDIGSVPVCGDNNKLAGFLTDRDITIRAIAKGRDPNHTKVQDTMSPSLIYVYDDQDIGESARVMKEHQVRRLPVLSRDKQLLGIVSLGDMAIETDSDLSGSTLRKISEPGRAHPDIAASA
jgi:CBS domain-containing protein